MTDSFGPGPPQPAEHRPIDLTIQFGKPTSRHNPASRFSRHDANSKINVAERRGRPVLPATAARPAAACRFTQTLISHRDNTHRSTADSGASSRSVATEFGPKSGEQSGELGSKYPGTQAARPVNSAKTTCFRKCEIVDGARWHREITGDPCHGHGSDLFDADEKEN